MDRLSKVRRSAIMSRIRGRGNKQTELNIISLFRKSGIKGWRRHKTIHFVFGKLREGKASDGTKFKPQVRPDVLFPKLKVALFIDGCFWHGCPDCYRRPKSRIGFWRRKVTRNRERDRFQRLELKREGWRVMQIWEHEVAASPERCVRRIQKALQKKKT
jgi:DNA mismatch endonuclease (patch repair protein)